MFISDKNDHIEYNQMLYSVFRFAFKNSVFGEGEEQEKLKMKQLDY